MIIDAVYDAKEEDDSEDGSSHLRSGSLASSSFSKRSSKTPSSSVHFPNMHDFDVIRWRELVSNLDAKGSDKSLSDTNLTTKEVLLTLLRRIDVFMRGFKSGSRVSIIVPRQIKDACQALRIIVQACFDEREFMVVRRAFLEVMPEGITKITNLLNESYPEEVQIYALKVVLAMLQHRDVSDFGCVFESLFI